LLRTDDPSTLPLLFHLNSEPWLNLEAYSDPVHEMLFKSVAPSATRVQLARPEDTPLRQSIRERRSCRVFADRSMPLASLAGILADTYSVTGVTDGPEGRPMYTRPVPSAGALYPLEIYVATRSVDALGDGLHHYHALEHALEPMKAGPILQELGDLLLGQYYLETANAAVIFTGVFQRTLKKYGPRGYRYMLYEAGHAAQNVCLLASELKLGTICTGGFYDGRLNRYLGLDGTSEAALYLVGIGHSRP
jgi:SagB-type dehydrogenase family enzyme